MTGDLEPRVRGIELDVARIGQRVDDHENDIRAFGPLVTEQATARKDVARLADDIHNAYDGVRRLEGRLEKHIEDTNRVRQVREERERERETKDRRYRIATWMAAAGMFLTFVSTTVAVVAVTHP